MHACPCGYYGDPTRECRRTHALIQRYLGKVSGPLLDRIDRHIEVPAAAYEVLRSNDKVVTSEEMRERILKTRAIQQTRGFYNPEIPPRQLRSLCAPDRMLRVARTIADLSASDGVSGKHLAEAVQYRGLDRGYWT